MPELMKNNAPAILLAKFKPRALAAAPIKSKPIQRKANNKNVPVPGPKNLSFYL